MSEDIKQVNLEQISIKKNNDLFIKVKSGHGPRRLWPLRSNSTSKKNLEKSSNIFNLTLNMNIEKLENYRMRIYIYIYRYIHLNVFLINNNFYFVIL